MADRGATAQPWRSSLLHDLQLALCRLDAERPSSGADVELIARWALVSADVCSAIAELSEPCTDPPRGGEPVLLRTPLGGDL
jgi:hypothetical protein